MLQHRVQKVSKVQYSSPRKRQGSSRPKLVKSDDKTASLTSVESSINDLENSTIEIALELQQACASGASPDKIHSILLGRSERAVTHNECESSCRSLGVTYDRNSFTSLEQNNDLSFLQLRNARFGSLLSTNACADSERKTKPGQVHRTSICLYDGDEGINFEESSDDGKSVSPLTCDALSRKGAIEKSLIEERQKLWETHSGLLFELQREIQEILTERKFVLEEFEKSETRLLELQEQYKLEHEREDKYISECKKSFFKRIKGELTKDKPRPADLEYFIGVATMNKNDLERYYYELEERHLKLMRKYKELNESIFGEIDQEIERTLCIRLNGSQHVLRTKR